MCLKPHARRAIAAWVLLFMSSVAVQAGDLAASDPDEISVPSPFELYAFGDLASIAPAPDPADITPEYQRALDQAVADMQSKGVVSAALVSYANVEEAAR
jgi:hypothetical protein